MSQKREIRQHTQEISFRGVEPIGSHTAGTDISGVVELERPANISPNLLLIQTLDQNIYYTTDGTNPIPTGSVVGFLIKADDPVNAIPIGEGTRIKVVQATATAQLQYQWSE